MSLTVRQTAVLAALERRRECSLWDLREDFPQLAPSTVERVVRALERRGLAEREGNDAEVFIGGVTFRPRVARGEHHGAI